MPTAEFGKVVPVQQYLERTGVSDIGLVVPATLKIGSENLNIRSTGDFPPSNFWSTTKGAVIDIRRDRGDFNGRSGREDGFGDARNLFRAGVHHEVNRNGVHFTGLDLDGWRAALGFWNLKAANVPEDRLTILVGGAVNDLLARGSDGAIQGWNLACLPQAPEYETDNHADGIDSAKDNLEGANNLVLGPFSVEQYGLTLNAAYLRALREAVKEDGTDVQVTLSGRVPASVRSRLFSETGWRVEEIWRTREQGLQDWDTGVSHVDLFSRDLNPLDGEGFFERTPGGLFRAITPTVAEERRVRDGQDLNVHHHVFEYLAVPEDVPSGRKPNEIPVYVL